VAQRALLKFYFLSFLTTQTEFGICIWVFRSNRSPLSCGQKYKLQKAEAKLADRTQWQRGLDNKILLRVYQV